MNKDFTDFQESHYTQSPAALDGTILGNIKRDLMPSTKVIYAKVISVQAFIGFITLLFCPQFKLSLTNNYDLFHFFHRTFGHYGCMLACGSVFIGTGALFANSILSKSELIKIQKTASLNYLLFSGLAVLVFLFIGAEVYLDLTLFWIIGATISGSLVSKATGFVRFSNIN